VLCFVVAVSIPQLLTVLLLIAPYEISYPPLLDIYAEGKYNTIVGGEQLHDESELISMFAPRHNGLTVVGQIVLAVILTLLLAVAGAAQPSSSESSSKPWWKQEKIRFFWGQWKHLEKAGVPWEETMANLSRAGATVFVDSIAGWEEPNRYDPDRARLAHKYGIHYFGALFVTTLHQFAAEMQAPHAVGEQGEWPGGWYHPCPLHRPLYEQWFLEPMLEAARSGLVDGFHMDWEEYGGRGEAGICYCDDCFAAFLKRKKLQVEEEVPKEQRYQWLQKRDLVDDYEQVFEERRTEMFSDSARRIHQAKPDLVFSGYGYFMMDNPIRSGLHTPQVPFFVVDHRHYFEDHTRPWWESYQTHLQKLGFLRIAGSWDNSFFGGQPESNSSAPQWMYDAAINSDGYWLWFEEEPTPDVWRSFWIANRRIRATEAKVGQFLLDGKQDIHFVTPVEWSGNPELDRKIIQRTYHLDDEHLVHLHNVDTDRPMRLRLRFPRLRAESRWVVTDPMADLTYAHDGGKIIWTGQELRDGIGLCLEKRSELFVKLAPAESALPSRPAATIASDEVRPMPSHADAAAVATGSKELPRLYVMENSIYGQKLDSLEQSATEVLALPKTSWTALSSQPRRCWRCRKPAGYSNLTKTTMGSMSSGICPMLQPAIGSL